MRRLSVLAVLALAFLTAELQAASWSVGIGVGAPYYRPWWGPRYYYRPYPIYVTPAPVYVVEPAAPTVVESLPVGQGATPAVSAVAPAAPTAYSNHRQAEIDRYLTLLVDPRDSVRADSATQLGQLKAQRAVDRLAATLSGDRSPTVREAAARALGVIGTPKTLPALKHAAQVDPDPNVRHIAEVAVEMIHEKRMASSDNQR